MKTSDKLPRRQRPFYGEVEPDLERIRLLLKQLIKRRGKSLSQVGMEMGDSTDPYNTIVGHRLNGRAPLPLDWVLRLLRYLEADEETFFRAVYTELDPLRPAKERGQTR